MNRTPIAAGVVLAATLTFLAAGDASAQRRGGSPRMSSYGQTHRLEIVPHGGYRWTVSQDVSGGGKVDLKSTGYWGIAIDLNVPAPDTQVRLVYDRQETRFTAKRAGIINEEIPTDVEYWHIGALKGVRQGNVLPFGLLTLGGTRFAVDGFEDSWKFSMVFGLGAKMYVNERIGLMFQARLPVAFTSGGLGIGVGTGGAGVSVVGTGITQIDVGAGVTILLGS